MGGVGGGGQSLVLCYCVDPAKNIGEPNLINGMLITITNACMQLKYYSPQGCSHNIQCCASFGWTKASHM